MSDFEREVIERLTRIEALLSERTHARKYPWHTLKEKGDKFLHECPWHDAQRVRASIAGNAIRQFGKGVVSTKLVKAGVLVMRVK